MLFGGILKNTLFSLLGNDGNPFSIMGFMHPTNAEGKYVIESEGLRLAFVKKGGALANLWINDTNCRELDIVLGFDNSTQYDSYHGFPVLNGAIGRYAGVIRNGEYELNGDTHHPSKNHRDGQSTIHGGDKGWGNVLVHPGARTKNSITFVVFDRGMDGFPGRAAASLTHTLLPYEWRISFGVTPLLHEYPISLSQQVFWTLNGLRGSADHALHLPYGGMRLEQDGNGVPTGSIVGNKRGSSLDFWSGPRKPSETLDDTFLINRRGGWEMNTAPVASLSSNDSGISVDLYTNQEALHVVTWDDYSGQVQRKKSQGEGSVPPQAAISIQMQDWTDAINHPEWQREDKVIWGPDRLYTMYSTYKFSVTRDPEKCG
ncbi:hypothetical protein NHJ13734_009359 [Beauveria thailandica]